MAMAVRSAAKMSAMRNRKKQMNRNKTLPELVSAREKRRFDAPSPPLPEKQFNPANPGGLGASASLPALAKYARAFGASAKKPPAHPRGMGTAASSRLATNLPRHKISLYLAGSLNINKINIIR